jgi:outer membrane protein OmpA-like peptidoglycan-associated protein
MQSKKSITPYLGMLVLALSLPTVSISQSPADTIILGNPSFEDMPRAGGKGGSRIPIRGWEDCGAELFPGESPPDIHPHPEAWQVTKDPEDGVTYLGMVVRDDETYESVSQAFSAPLKGGQCYAFSVWLCRSESYYSPRNPEDAVEYPFTQPTVLRIYGGKSLCHAGELLAESEPVTPHTWKQYLFKFEPVMDHRFITLQAFYKTPVLAPYNGHILVDNLSAIIRMSCAQNDIAKVIEKPKVDPVINVKPTPPNRTSNSSAAKPAVTKPPTVVKSDAPKLLTELERNKLHQGKTIRIENLYFKADSSRIQFESNPVLDEIALFMKQNPDVIIEIGGHTNTIPDSSYCDILSTERAKSVTEYLIKKGVPKNQLQYKGYGKSKPLIPNDTYSRQWQAKNQRVEIKILSLG